MWIKNKDIDIDGSVFRKKIKMYVFFFSAAYSSSW